MTGLAAAGAAAMALGGLVPAQAATHDPVPSRQAARWLVGQFSDSGMMYDNEHHYFNVGRTIDAALELTELGGHAAQVQETADTLERRFIPGPYMETWYWGSEQIDYGPYFLANQTAKALLFAEVSGHDVHTWTSTDLLADLESVVLDSAPSQGRISDQHRGVDSANLYGQALAARALSAAHSRKSAAVTTYLLTQQCAAGYFSRDMADASTGATCDDREATPDTEATAYTVIQLSRLAHPTAAVRSALSRARAWLGGVQEASGAWRRVPGGAVNAASTGLAVRALAGSPAAQRGAVWIRKHQVRDAGVCSATLRGDRGAVGYASRSYASERRQGITRAAQDQWRATTIQALLALRELPAATAPIQLTTARRTVAAGERITARVRHAAPYSQVCVTVGQHHVAHSTGAAGRATVRVVVPKGQPHRNLAAVDSDGRRDTLRLSVHRR